MGAGIPTARVAAGNAAFHRKHMQGELGQQEIRNNEELSAEILQRQGLCVKASFSCLGPLTLRETFSASAALASVLSASVSASARTTWSICSRRAATADEWVGWEGELVARGRQVLPRLC